MRGQLEPKGVLPASSGHSMAGKQASRVPVLRAHKLATEQGACVLLHTLHHESARLALSLCCCLVQG